MAVTLFGNDAPLHDRLAGEAGSFAAALAQLAAAEEVHVPVRRANAFHLAAIIDLACRRRGVDYAIEPFDPHPATTLAQRFADHLVWLRNQGRRCRVKLIEDDLLLMPLLEHISERAAAGNETDLLRLLGVLCDTALIGPHWFVFEVINRCNARCHYCNIHAPCRQPGRDFLDTVLPFKQFTATVDELARLGADGVTVLANGEPMLHPDFVRMIVYARKKGLRVNFFTNGLLLDEEAAQAIVVAGPEEMFCTVSAATSETYARLHHAVGEMEWRELMDNLRRFFALREAADTPHPEAWMVNVICRTNAYELLAMADLAAELGFDGLRPQLLRVDEYNRGLALTEHDVAWLQASLPNLIQRCRDLGLKLWDAYPHQVQHCDNNPDEWSGDEFVDHGCFIGWALGLAKSNGDLSFCCTVKPVANLSEGPFGQLWTGGLYHQARLAAKDLRRAGLLPMRDGQPLYTDYCHHCDNHDINRRLHEQMTAYDLWRYLD
ncbi:MAG TPA: radical SAM protein [bacterium]|nr:radical SAM protein [bacterium]